MLDTVEVGSHLDGQGNPATPGTVAAVSVLVAWEMAIAMAVPPIVMVASSNLR